MTHAVDSERGMTILEIMIVLAIVGLMMLIGLPAMRSYAGTDLREDTNAVAAGLRSAYELAALSGVHHRVVLDLDAASFKIEACPETMRLAAGDDEALVDAKALEEIPKAPSAGPPGQTAAEVIGADSPEAAVAAAAALAGGEIGGARCQMPSTPNGNAEARGNARELRKGRGVSIRRVDVQHLRKPAQTGVVAINFFPLGYAEKAVIELAGGDGTTFSIVLHGLSGRVEVVDGEVDVDRHMRRDAAGDTADER